MARLNVYVPDELARRAREAGLNVSKLTQESIESELARNHLTVWLDDTLNDPPLTGMPPDLVVETLAEVRAEYDDDPRR